MIVIQRTDTGIQFVVTVKDEQSGLIVDVSAATNIKFIFRQPNRTTYSVTGSLYTDGKDGKVQYVSQSTDFLISGVWKIQVSYQVSGSSKLTSWASFQISPNLSDLI